MNEYDRYGDYSQQTPEASGSGGEAVKYMLVGMGIGAAVALLLAPVSGGDLRRAIRRGFRQSLDSISEGTQNLRDRGSNLLGFTRRRVGNAPRGYQQGGGI